ncbi:uncharacterized protein LOC128957018 [Oppia nitens]|uniref:uncharacterized protein LOC128957018 n=1 Tax=Oppia nitens TaxID=1686743 RepID=UPI0023D9AD16|nr:uncharacterized protein LOC128957018 [Oppia nitens]
MFCNQLPVQMLFMLLLSTNCLIQSTVSVSVLSSSTAAAMAVTAVVTHVSGGGGGDGDQNQTYRRQLFRRSTDCTVDLEALKNCVGIRWKSKDGPEFQCCGQLEGYCLLNQLPDNCLNSKPNSDVFDKKMKNCSDNHGFKPDETNCKALNPPDVTTDDCKKYLPCYSYSTTSTSTSTTSSTGVQHESNVVNAGARHVFNVLLLVAVIGLL